MDELNRLSAEREAELHAAHVDGAQSRLDSTVLLVAYDPEWPLLYAREADRIRAALGDRAIVLDHTGSTSVPGLDAKPKIDITLGVPDSSDEPAYVPDLEAAGYRLHIREPEWHEHRLFKGPDTDINLHVFTAGSSEIERMVRFRDWLRTHPADFDLYLAEKRRLAAQTWDYMQGYADAKSAVVEEILTRALRDPASP